VHPARHLLLSALAVFGLAGLASADPVLPVTSGVRQSGPWNVTHISGALHVAGIARPVDVNCLSGCSGGASGATQQGPAGQERWPMSAHQAGAWSVTANAGSGTFTVGGAVSQSGEWRLAHVSSVLHVQAAGPLPVTLSQTIVNQGGAWIVNVGHIASQLHLANTGLLNPLAVRCVNAGATAFESCAGAGGGSAGDAVNVFHQSTIRHVSSVTHVVGGLYLTNRAGAAVSVTGSSLDSNVTNTVSVTGTIGATQSGEWTIRHVGSVLHVAGVIRGFGPQGTNVVDAANAALQVNCVIGCSGGGGASVIAHVSAVTHVAGVVRAFGKQATDVVDTANAALRVNVVVGGSTPSEPATFSCVFDRIAPAANKYLATLFNTSATRRVVVHSVYVFNWNLTAVTGVILQGELWRLTARTAGTGVTAVARDTADTLSSGIACDTGSTSVTDSSLLRRLVYSAEEAKIGALTLESVTSTADQWALAYKKEAGQKGITLRQNEGLSVKNITSSTVGTVSVVVIFTDEPA